MEYFSSKKSTFVAVLIFGLLINTAFCKPQDNFEDIPQDDDYNDYNDESGNPEEPRLVSNYNYNLRSTSKPQEVYFREPHRTLTVKEGDSVTLHCNPINLQNDNVVLWYNGSNQITQNNVAINSKVKLLDRTNIVIPKLEITDRGYYYCKILPQEVSYAIRLDVRPLYEFNVPSYPEYPPPTTTTTLAPMTTVMHKHVEIFKDGRSQTNRVITVREGSTISFQCIPYGIDNAIIKWSLEGVRAKNYESVDIDESTGKFTIKNISHHQAGTLSCLADDKSSEPATASVTIIVQYIPHIWTHRHHVNTAPGEKEAILTCEYKSDPIAYVEWRKKSESGEEEILKYSPRYKIYSEHSSQKNNTKNEVHKNHESHVNKTILIIKGIIESDIGKYICSAKNALGMSNTTIELILKPEKPQFEEYTYDGKIANFSWLVNSKQPLRQASIHYKIKDTQTNWNSAQIKLPLERDHTGTWKLIHEVELTPGIWHVNARVEDSKGRWSDYSEDEVVELKNPTPPEEILHANIGGGGGTLISSPEGTDNSNKLLVVPSIIISCLLLTLRIVPSF